MQCRILIINESATSSKRRETKKFVDFLSRWTKKMVLKMKVSKVNKTKKIEEPKLHFSLYFLKYLYQFYLVITRY